MAREYYFRGMKLDDSNHTSARALAQLEVKQNRISQAIQALRQALRRDRRSASLNTALGKLLTRRAGIFKKRRMMQAAEKALANATKVMELAIAAEATAERYYALGAIYHQRTRFSQARECWEKALELKPNFAMAASELASLHVDAGNIDLALELFEQSIQAAPRHGKTHFRYTRAKKFTVCPQTQSYINTLSGIVDDLELPAPQRVYANFALAKVLDDIGQYDQAWRHYDRANRLKPGHSDSRVVASDAGAETIDSIRRCTESTMRFFDRRRIEAMQFPSEDHKVCPVFIVGMPRSGTTLTEQIISSHPDIYGAGELGHIQRIVQQITRTSQLETDVPNGHKMDSFKRWNPSIAFESRILPTSIGRFCAGFVRMRNSSLIKCPPIFCTWD